MSRSQRFGARHWDGQLTMKSNRIGALNARLALACWIAISVLLWAAIIATAEWLI